MELKHQCKICYRRFANGKSMGGHMRSHFVTLPVQKTFTSPSFESKNTLIVNFASPQPDLSKASLYFNSNSTPVSQVETSCIATKRSAATTGEPVSPHKRSKRISRFTEAKLKSGPMRASPHHDITSSSESLMLVEEVANCLMKLSRDKWPEDVKHPLASNRSDSIETKILEDEDDDNSFDRTKESTSCKCKKCNKVFKSYQALGGHMRNHKRAILSVVPSEKREFECEICLKTFESGQALGGHKKAHWLTERNLMKVKSAPVVLVDSDTESDSGSGFQAPTEVDESSSYAY